MHLSIVLVLNGRTRIALLNAPLGWDINAVAYIFVYKFANVSLFRLNESRIGNESVPIQLTQRWFPGLAISNAKM